MSRPTTLPQLFALDSLLATDEIAVRDSIPAPLERWRCARCRVSILNKTLKLPDWQ